jgi:hypothetical protein
MDIVDLIPKINLTNYKKHPVHRSNRLKHRIRPSSSQKNPAINLHLQIAGLELIVM